MFFCFIVFPTVSAEILKSSLTTMERQIQRLENDIENFPKTDDQQDKFVEKMSISFLSWPFSHLAWFRAENLLLKNTCIVAFEDIACAILSTAARAVCALPGSGKQFKSLGVIGGTQGNLGNGSGCLAVRC